MSHGESDRCGGGHGRRIAVLGADSLVGRRLLPLAVAAGWNVRAFSRSAATVAARAAASTGVSWSQLDGAGQAAGNEAVACWVSLCPLWALAERLPWLESHAPERLVALSSTSRFTKLSSADRSDRDLAARLAAAEETVAAWASARGVAATLLRPTLVYDGLHDRNVAVIAAFIRRWGWFPLVGEASGLRQPVHTDDVATACLAALSAESLEPAYELSGGETLPYREMVRRVFLALGRPARFVTLPAWGVRRAMPLVRLLPRFRHLSTAMFERMDVSLAFDHSRATRDLGFQPRGFALSIADRPVHD